MNKETKIQRLIMVKLSEAGHTVWRNETGRFWTGIPIHKDGQTVTLKNAMMIPLGLCVEAQTSSACNTKQGDSLLSK